MACGIDLSGRVALVTGASRGIGAEVAHRLAQAGAHVALVARSIERLKALAAEIEQRHGVRALALETDVRSDEQVQATVASVLEQLGGLHVLVNNAGITRDALLLRTTSEAWQEVLDVNLGGAYRFTRAALRPMVRQRHGRVIAISSVVGLRGNAGQSNYAASKAGLIGFCKSVAREVGARGVTVNVVAPGLIETDMAAALDERQRSAFLDHVALGRIGTAGDVADAVLFLASDLAGYVTGEVLRVDGGFAM
ncbi:MAG: 3-oxoacyl-[acyl-carrier-protein] reductase [Planctomycetota bacterium]|nr:MAG: 3-oxoacyl-[acyl-carrier-protein] reductase [Planctomycetota bacterium]